MPAHGPARGSSRVLAFEACSARLLLFLHLDYTILRQSCLISRTEVSLRAGYPQAFTSGTARVLPSTIARSSQMSCLGAENVGSEVEGVGLFLKLLVKINCVDGEASGWENRDAGGRRVLQD